MEVKHLIFFKKAAELEHFTKAAEQLNVSQPFLSLTISELEKELGAPLFDHSGRNVVLNDCGKAYYQRVLNILNELKDGQKEVLDIRKQHISKLSFVTNVSTYMPALFALCSQCIPDLKLRQYSAKRSHLMKNILDGTADYIISSPTFTESPELESFTLLNEIGVVVFPSNHWLSKRKTVSLSELTHERFVSAAKGYGIRDVVDNYFQNLGFEPDIVIESNDVGAINDFVLEGLGIAIAPKSYALKNSRLHGHFLELDDGPVGTIGIAWKKGRYINSSDLDFLDTAVRFFSLIESKNEQLTY